MKGAPVIILREKMILNKEEYRNKILGCWMGKNIGGTLGAPFEWFRQTNDISFYTEDHNGNPWPNDDLDIQLLWLIALEERGPAIDSRVLADYWSTYVTPHWAEYGTAKTHLNTGILPPLSGSYRNEYKNSCGAFIRSEIWACITPGAPEVAAKYAYEDAIIDHGNGEGMYAAVFMAALESAAFVLSDIRELIEIGLSYIPEDCGIAGAVNCAVESYTSGKTWLEAREMMLKGFRGQVQRGDMNRISEEDKKKGFHEGKFGWDAPSNVGITIIGILYGEGKFGETLCTAVNCGEDTDCTAATAGSVLGIIYGYDSIPEKWIKPIGHGIKTVTLNSADLCSEDHPGGIGYLGPFGTIIPSTIDNLTDRTVQAAHRAALHNGIPLVFDTDKLTNLSDIPAKSLHAGLFGKKLYENIGGPVFRFDFFDVAVDYESDPRVYTGKPKQIKLKITNKYRTQAHIRLRWYTPDGQSFSSDLGKEKQQWDIRPARVGNVFLNTGVPGEDKKTLSFTLTPEFLTSESQRFSVELTVDGRSTVMLVPIHLINGDLD